MKWLVLIAGYVGLLIGFRKLGGFRAAGDAITAWGRVTAAERRKKIESLFKG
jgi:hypothetical protein